MVYCIVKACKNHLVDKLHGSSSVSFYGFPKNAETKMKWMSVINLIPDDHCVSYKVCALHFKPTDFINPYSSKRKLLRKTAVPSQHLNIKVSKPAMKAVAQQGNVTINNVIKTESRTTTTTPEYILTRQESESIHNGVNIESKTEVPKYESEDQNYKNSVNNESKSPLYEYELDEQEYAALDNIINIEITPVICENGLSRLESVPNENVNLNKREIGLVDWKMTLKNALHSTEDNLALSPKQIQLKFKVLKETIIKRNKKINTLQKTVHRNLKKINSLEMIIKDLQKQNKIK